MHSTVGFGINLHLRSEKTGLSREKVLHFCWNKLKIYYSNENGTQRRPKLKKIHQQGRVNTVPRTPCRALFFSSPESPVQFNLNQTVY